MTSMVVIFLVTFLVFDASEVDLKDAAFYDSAPEERKLFFGSLCGLLSLTQQVLLVCNLLLGRSVAYLLEVLRL